MFIKFHSFVYRVTLNTDDGSLNDLILRDGPRRDLPKKLISVLFSHDALFTFKDNLRAQFLK